MNIEISPKNKYSCLYLMLAFIAGIVGFIFWPAAVLAGIFLVFALEE